MIKKLKQMFIYMQTVIDNVYYDDRSTLRETHLEIYLAS